MGKIYARQIPPEYQESPIYYGKFETEFPLYWPEITLTGNRNYYGYRAEAYEDAERATNDAPEEYYRAKESGEPYRIAEALELYGIEKHNGKRWSPRELGQWKRLFQDWDHNPYDKRNADRRTLEALELITGEPYGLRTLRGCSQSEWIECYYPRKKYSTKDLERLEMEYFNTGEEWTIYDADPDGEEEPGDSFSMYVYSWQDDEKRAEIAAAAGWGTAEEVELHPFKGWTRSPKWA